MKKKICDLKPGTPFKYRKRIFIKDSSDYMIQITNGNVVDPHYDFFVDGEETFVTVCKRIRKSDIKERV